MEDLVREFEVLDSEDEDDDSNTDLLDGPVQLLRSLLRKFLTWQPVLSTRPSGTYEKKLTDKYLRPKQL